MFQHFLCEHISLLTGTQINRLVSTYAISQLEKGKGQLFVDVE